MTTMTRTAAAVPAAQASGFEHRCADAQCRVCRRQGLLPVLDLGMMPLVDTLVTPEQLRGATPEPRYPLEVGFCPECTLVQVLHTVPPEEVFHQDYPYFSSFSQTLLAHSRSNALHLIESRRLGSQSLVVELASNDGYLLRNFAERGIPVLGIDPAPGPAQAAQKAGVPTLCAFFGEDLARKLAAEGKRADVVIANNVMAHVADINGFVRGIRTILKDDGILVSESPYLRDLIQHCEFDTIYHEHLCYYSVTALDHLFRRNGLYLNDLEPLAIHGGSLRVYAGTKPNVSPRVRQYLAEEKEQGLTRHDYYRSFAARVHGVRASLWAMVQDLRARKKRIAAYGASAKGAVLLNYAGLGTDLVEYVVDRNVHKQGRHMPGVHIPIVEPARLVQDVPDYVLLLVWNIQDEVMAQQAAYRGKGGRFIVPIPTPRIV